LVFCAERGEEPEKPFSGNVLLRVGPEIHKEITLAARREGKSVNAYIIERLRTKKPRSAA
jgi:predicted HicB family RNase H-like nuclease